MGLGKEDPAPPPPASWSPLVPPEPHHSLEGQRGLEGVPLYSCLFLWGRGSSLQLC